MAKKREVTIYRPGHTHECGGCNQQVGKHCKRYGSKKDIKVGTMDVRGKVKPTCFEQRLIAGHEKRDKNPQPQA
jgi:hypothetical protein